LNTLACLYDSQGRAADAEPYYRRSLAIEEKARGPEHPNVAALYDNLATVCHAQRKYDEAEQSYKRALATREKAPKERRPELARTERRRERAPTLHNLAAL